MMVRAASALLGALLLLASAAEGPGDWPQWRGPNRDGSVAATARGEWPARLPLVWEKVVGGGYSGPVAVGDRIWVHSRQGSQEVVRSLGLSSGEVLWESRYEAPFRQDPDGRAHGSGPYSTPALADGRLFTYGVRAVLSAWDAGTGKLLWRRDSADEFEPGFPYFGAAASPLVWEGLCFVHLGGDSREEPEGPSVGAIVALRAADGREVWRWNRDAPALGASPVICEAVGQPQLVFKTKRNIVGLDPLDGRELWRIPYRVSQDNTIVTPLCVSGGLLTSDNDLGMIAWRFRREGSGWAAERVWARRDVSSFTSSPVVAGGLVVGFSEFRSGQLFVMDPDGGKVLWRGAPRSGEHATLISWGNDVLAFLEGGTLIAGEVSRSGFRMERSYRLGISEPWAHAAIAGDRLVTRAGSRVAVYMLAGP